MIRKTALLVLVSILLGVCPVMGQPDPNDDDAVSSWILGDHKRLGVRMGYVKNQIEVGGGVTWAFEDQDNDPVAFGGYGLYHLPEALNIENLPLFSLFGEHIKAVTYFGIHGGVQTTWEGDDDERWFVGPIAGMVINKFIFDSVRDEISVVTEVQYNRFSQDNDESDRDELAVLFGLRIWIP